MRPRRPSVFRITWLVVAAILLLPAKAIAASDVSDRPIADLVAARQEMALSLAEPIVDCVRRQDTSHPIFHGCVDWHSAVHGHWALTAVARVTANPKLLDAVTARLQPALIAEERQDLAASPGFEMPYGRAWFLRLAMEYERAGGDQRLRPMAEELAVSLADHLQSVGLDPLVGSYDSETWAAINLRNWGIFRGDAALVALVDGLVADAARTVPRPCPFQRDLQDRSFMAICTNWAWLVGEGVGGAAGKAAMLSILPPDMPMPPVTRPASDHLNGLDFSRSWGLWHLWRRTGDPAYLKAYADHLRLAYRNRDWWAGDYHSVGHWVAQFGVLAVMPLFEADYP